jgi:hypothetical protein
MKGKVSQIALISSVNEVLTIKPVDDRKAQVINLSSDFMLLQFSES